MAGEWRETTLGNLLAYANGRASPERADGFPYPVYGSNGIIGYASETNAEQGAIVIGRVGSYCGSLYLPKQKCWVTDNAIRATALGDNDPRFLFYLLGALRLNDWRAGSRQPLLNQEILSRIPTTAPTPGEQRAIGRTLGGLDDKIELNWRMNETLEAMARALFKSWFVDFDPVRAKAEGRDPGLPKPIADLFPARLVDSELGDIPEGWTIRPLDGLARFVNGLALQKYPPINGKSLPVIKIAQLRSQDTNGADRASGDLDPDYIVRDGDILFSWSGSLECVLWSGGPGALNQHLFKVIALALLFRDSFASRRLPPHRRGKGDDDGDIQRYHLSDASLAIPSSPLMSAASTILEPMVEGLWRREVQSRTLAAIREALLPKLISGELRIGGTGGFINGETG
jgi:type I restriction enzyme, S subunit